MMRSKIITFYVTRSFTRRMTRQERRRRWIENMVNVDIGLCAVASMVYCGYVLRGWVG